MALAGRPSRRGFLSAVGLTVVGVACSKGSPSVDTSPPAGTGSAVAGSLRALGAGAAQLSLLGSPSADSPANPGTIRFGFDLITPSNQVVQGGSPQVWVARDETTKAMGPFGATWYPFTAYGKTHDTSPKSPLPGTYVAHIQIPSAGNWFIAATVQSGSQRGFGSSAAPITDQALPGGIGTKAIPFDTPVATTDTAIARICTRNPVDHLHSITLTEALSNGKPTVVSFATPLLCESRLCGPVVDEQILASQSHGPGKANFIHVEEFLPGPDLTPPPVTLENQAPAFKAWHLQTEPWVFVIDKGGVIRARLEGPTTAPEIGSYLQPLL